MPGLPIVQSARPIGIDRLTARTDGIGTGLEGTCRRCPLYQPPVGTMPLLRQNSVPPLQSGVQSVQKRLGTSSEVRADTDRTAESPQGSMLVWARSGPAAGVQAQWTAALARGLERDATLVDVVETPWSLAPSQAEAALQDRVLDRLETLRRLSQDEFRNVPADLQVRLVRNAERNVLNSAVSERRDPVVLWAPVRERLIRALLHKTTCTVLVIRCPQHESELPWVGVAEDDKPALPVAQALIRGSHEEMSLRLVPQIDSERVDDVPCRVACVSLPMPGWWASHLLRRRRRSPASKGAVMEVYRNGDRVL